MIEYLVKKFYLMCNIDSTLELFYLHTLMLLEICTYIMNHVFMPENWDKRWPSYHRMMKNYQSKGKNAYDDPEDATTGLYEMVEHKIRKPKSEKAATMKKHGFF